MILTLFFTGTVDKASYKEHLKKMNEIFDKTPSALKELESLQDLTFENIISFLTNPGKMSALLVRDFIGSNCTLLKSLHLVSCFSGCFISLHSSQLVFKSSERLIRSLDQIHAKDYGTTEPWLDQKT